MDPQDRHIKIHREEVERLLHLKSKLDHEEMVSSHANEYQKLGWVLQTLNSRDDTDLGVDTSADPETWVNRLWQPGVPVPEINLGVQTGKRSRLMVLEVDKGTGAAVLDQYGPWRAECVAVLGDRRERHFYAWQPSPLFESASLAGSADFRWYGEGQVILVPPSIESESQERWQWLCPPWETPPQCPGQAVADFLQQGLNREPQPRPEVSCLVSPFEPLLQAMSASYPSMQSYYQGILTAAATVGIRAPEVLRSMLWHAPRGNAHQCPEGRADLEKLVAADQVQSSPATFPENVPWNLHLDNARSQDRESSVGSSGPARFLGRSRAQPPQPGGTGRTPFSARSLRGNLRKI